MKDEVRVNLIVQHDSYYEKSVEKQEKFLFKIFKNDKNQK